MKLYIISIVVLLCGYTIFSYIKTIVFIRKAKKYKKDTIPQQKNEKNMVIAIPCLREQHHIENTVRHFRNITKDIPIILVTTSKEFAQPNYREQSTQEIIQERIMPQYSNVYWVEYPYTKGYMADQLNYMLDRLPTILEKNIDLKNTYLALYNADSYPSKEMFQEIENHIAKGRKVIQQYSYCMKNYETLSPLLKGFAIYQSNFEIKTGLMNGCLNLSLLYTHVVGHGLVVELDTLKKLGNFNTKFWCEDMYLGLQLQYHHIPITPVYTLENTETPNTLEKLIKQNAVWFTTTSQFYAMYTDIVKTGQGKHKWKGCIGMLNEGRCAINWLGFPFVLWTSTVLAVGLQEYVWLLAIIFSYIAYVTSNTVSTMRVISLLGNQTYKVTMGMIKNVLIATAISNIGPLYAIFAPKKEKYKTER